MYYLTDDDIRIIVGELSTFFINHNEPSPAFNESYKEKLQSVLAHPRDTFGGKDLYPDIFNKAACYFYFIIKLHPFFNGNKRVAIVSTYVFLRKNGYYFQVEEDLMYTFAKNISKSTSKQEVEFNKVIDFIRSNTLSTKQVTQNTNEENTIMSRLSTALWRLFNRNDTT